MTDEVTLVLAETIKVNQTLQVLRSVSYALVAMLFS